MCFDSFLKMAQPEGGRAASGGLVKTQGDWFSQEVHIRKPFLPAPDSRRLEGCGTSVKSWLQNPESPQTTTASEAKLESVQKPHVKASESFSSSNT